jgi:hypothetical protein
MALIKNYPWVRYGIRIPQIKAGLRQEIKNSQLKKYPYSTHALVFRLFVKNMYSSRSRIKIHITWNFPTISVKI